MKVIFNHNISDWYWQIYDEWSRNNEIVLPEYYKDDSFRGNIINFDVLEETVKENLDADFIFDFSQKIPNLINWTKRKIDIPLIVYSTNAIDRPYSGKMSIFANVWYAEHYAKPLMRKYNRDNLLYIGFAANSYIFYPKNLEKIYDIGFFGQFYEERGYWLRIVQKFCKQNKLIPYFPAGDGKKMNFSWEFINDTYNQTKINLAFAPMQKDGRIVNLRTFEICMSGNFQLMQYTPCLEEFFEIDEEIVCWKNKKELFEKIFYYLENDDEREKIAKNGYKKAIKNHTWSKRIEKIGAFLKEKKKIELIKYIINLNEILEKDEIKIQRTSKIIELILKKFGYKIRRDLKHKKVIKIQLKNEVFYYKPNLKNYHFIELNNKTMMVIKEIHSNSKINLDDWEDLQRIIYLSENDDLSLPQFGLLTNGVNWVIRDLKNRKWLKRIPTRNALKSRVNLKVYIIIRIIHMIKHYFKTYKLNKLITHSNLIRHFIFIYFKVEKKIYKL